MESVSAPTHLESPEAVRTLFPIRGSVAPPLKWVGGKRWLVPVLLRLWETRSSLRLAEPFAGGLSIALGLCPERAVIGDANPHVMNVYSHLKTGLAPADCGEGEGWPAVEAEVYARIRSEFNVLVASEAGRSSAKAAALFYWLNRTCFKGICRFSKDGRFNVPYGNGGPSVMLHDDFSVYRRALALWDFQHGDFRAMPICADDFVYADPPYDETFVGYNGDGFSWTDQADLADMLAGHRGPVIASNSATAAICALYASRGFEVRQITAQRGIGSHALEMFAWRNLPTAEVDQALREVPQCRNARDEAPEESAAPSLFDDLMAS